MSTDRELLELAAKAAGIDGKWDESTPFFSGYIYHSPGENEFGSTTDEHIWNPLADDGDALRLAVKLNMHIHADFDCGAVSSADVVYFESPEFECEIVTELRGDDPYAATRRAIVRAAAEIGRNM